MSVLNYESPESRVPRGNREATSPRGALSLACIPLGGVVGCGGDWLLLWTLQLTPSVAADITFSLASFLILIGTCVGIWGILRDRRRTLAMISTLLNACLLLAWLLAFVAIHSVGR